MFTGNDNYHMHANRNVNDTYLKFQKVTRRINCQHAHTYESNIAIKCIYQALNISYCTHVPECMCTTTIGQLLMA